MSENECETIELPAADKRFRGIDADAGEKDYELQTFECGHCGAETRASHGETHTHFGDVCPDCVDARVWSVEDADLPDDVQARMNDHKTFSATNIANLMRDVIHHADYRRHIARKRAKKDSLHSDTPDEEAAKVPDGIKTGKGGKRDAMGTGNWVKGTGLRRPKGAFHKKTHWRTILSDAKETGLIERADDGDYDDENENARWTATEKGRDVFAELARCPQCGAQLNPFKHVSTYSVGRRTKKDSWLSLNCPDCDAMRDAPTGMVIQSSQGRMQKIRLEDVDYDDE